jgi:hypothetical protein
MQKVVGLRHGASLRDRCPNPARRAAAAWAAKACRTDRSGATPVLCPTPAGRFQVHLAHVWPVVHGEAGAAVAPDPTCHLTPVPRVATSVANNASVMATRAQRLLR